MPKLRGKVRHSAERTDYQVSRNERLRRPRQVLVVQGRRLGREDFSQEPKVTEAFDMPLEHLPPPPLRGSTTCFSNFKHLSEERQELA